MTKRKILSIFGFLAILPSLLLVVMGLSGLEPVAILDNPFVVLGGLGLALITNVPLVADFNTYLEKGDFVGSLTLKLKNGLVNLSVIILSFILLGTITLYLFLENFQPR